MRDSQYDTDFYAWANAQAALLRAGRLGDADMENIAEEIESLGRSEKRKLINRLAKLLVRLLEWQYPSGGRGSSWRTRIRLRRFAIEDRLRDNPSLEAQMPELLQRAHRCAALKAAVNTKLPASTFAASGEWSLVQIMNPDFWPDGPDEKEVPHARQQI